MSDSAEIKRLDDYQKLALVTAAGSQQDRLVSTALGLTGESGEFADMIKKHVFHGHTLDREDLKKELGDILWYVAVAAHTHGFDLSEVATTNIEKLKRRYPEGYSEERSINREE